MFKRPDSFAFKSFYIGSCLVLNKDMSLHHLISYIILHLIQSLYLNSISFSQNILYSHFSCPGLDPGLLIAFTNHISLVSFNQEKISYYFLCLLTLTFFKCTGQLFYILFLILSLSDISLIWFRLWILSKNTTDHILDSWCFTPRHTYCWFVPILVILILITDFSSIILFYGFFRGDQVISVGVC